MLDHLAYPHIFDAIWSSMSFADLAVARRVSPTWRERADKRLASQVRHVSWVLREDAAAGGAQPARIGLCARGAGGALSLLQVIGCTTRYTAARADGPQKKKRKLQSQHIDALGAPWAALLASGRVTAVDIVGFDATHYRFLCRMLRMMPGVGEETYGGVRTPRGSSDDGWYSDTSEERVRAPPPRPTLRWINTHPRAQAEVPFTPLGPDSPVFFVALRPDGAPPQIALPDDLQPAHAVISLACYADPLRGAAVAGALDIPELPERRFRGEQLATRTLDDLTVILNDATGGALKIAGRETSRDCYEDERGVLCNYSRQAVGLEGTVRIVGLERFFESPPELAAYQEWFQYEWWPHAFREYGHNERDRDAEAASLRFLTHEQFRSTKYGVGPRAYRLFNVQ